MKTEQLALNKAWSTRPPAAMEPLVCEARCQFVPASLRLFTTVAQRCDSATMALAKSAELLPTGDMPCTKSLALVSVWESVLTVSACTLLIDRQWRSH